MTRRHFLLVCHDAGGTIPPMIAIAAALTRAGHDVSMLSQPSVEQRAIAVGCDFIPFSAIPDYARDVALEDQLELIGPVTVGSSVGDDLLDVARARGRSRRRRREPRRCARCGRVADAAVGRAVAQHVQDVRRHVVRRDLAPCRARDQRDTRSLRAGRGRRVARGVRRPRSHALGRSGSLRCAGRTPPRDDAALRLPRPPRFADRNAGGVPCRESRLESSSG